MTGPRHAAPLLTRQFTWGCACGHLQLAPGWHYLTRRGAAEGLIVHRSWYCTGGPDPVGVLGVVVQAPH